MSATRLRHLAALSLLLSLFVCALPSEAAPPKDVDAIGTPTVLVFGLGPRCRYCVQLKNEIAKVTRTTGDAVRFRDVVVDQDRATTYRYRVVLSPTLVFLNAQGSEVFRHQGLLDAAQIQERLVALGFWGGKG